MISTPKSPRMFRVFCNSADAKRTVDQLESSCRRQMELMSDDDLRALIADFMDAPAASISRLLDEGAEMHFAGLACLTMIRELWKRQQDREKK